MILQTRKIPSIFFLLTLLFAGCATRYAAEDDQGYGYSNQRVSEHIFDIHYRGNKDTNPEIAKHYAYRRAAELTLSSGYTHFSVLEETSQVTYGKKEGKMLKDIPEQVQSFTESGGAIESPLYPEVHLTIYCNYASELTSGIDARKWIAKRFSTKKG